MTQISFNKPNRNICNEQCIIYEYLREKIKKSQNNKCTNVEFSTYFEAFVGHSVTLANNYATNKIKIGRKIET